MLQGDGVRPELLAEALEKLDVRRRNEWLLSRAF